MKFLIASCLVACATQQPIAPGVPLEGSAVPVGSTMLWGATVGEVCATIADLTCESSSSAGCRATTTALCCGGSPTRPGCDGLSLAPTQEAWNRGWMLCRAAIERGDGAACFGVYGALP